MLTQERLKEVLDYDPETGLFVWKVNRQGVIAGTIAGTGSVGTNKEAERYVIRVDTKYYLMSNLAWLYVNGEFPKRRLVNKNGFKGDNRIVNLFLKTKKEFSIEKELKNILDYNPETGIFTWKVNRGSHNCKGKAAGSIDRKGYLRIKLGNKNYRLHRLVWFYVYGEWPPDELEIDHKNHIRSDNRIDNLRLATDLETAHNQVRNKRNTSGFKGVCWKPKNKKWYARIVVNRKRISLGLYDSAEKAHRAYCEAADKYHGEYSCHG
ncbi:MAG: HNH endonuclease [Negativicutes bacterium]|nr:HNH endonuclease [Negativicutes bacterium]